MPLKVEYVDRTPWIKCYRGGFVCSCGAKCSAFVKQGDKNVLNKLIYSFVKKHKKCAPSCSENKT